jgi:DNA-binding transcriptional MerR regulator
MKEDGTYYAQEVADLLGINKRTLFRWEATGKLPFTPARDIRDWRVYEQRQVDWLKRNVKLLLKSRG